jgi:hypothetical protein
MEDDICYVTGNLIGSDSIVSLNSFMPDFKLLFADTKAIVITDITISIDKRVEFLWPNERFPILRTNIDVGGMLTIKSDTLAEKFALTGTIELRGGDLYYFQRSFYIKSGNLIFNESEMRFEPRLSIVAETRDKNQDGPVRILILIDDQPLTAFTPRIVSEPALSQVEILSILGQTFSGTPDDETNKIPQVFLAATTDLLAQFSLYRRVERSVRNLLHVDMFSARTQTLQNIVFQAINPNDENNPNRVGTYFDNTTVLAGKYIGSDMFVQAMVSTRYDKNKLDMGGISFEVDIGIELTSPLFNVRWDIKPQHENTLWIQDTSITIQKTWHLP